MYMWHLFILKGSRAQFCTGNGRFSSFSFYIYMVYLADTIVYRICVFPTVIVCVIQAQLHINTST